MSRDAFRNLYDLDIYYKPMRCHLSFSKEFPQEIIFKIIDISEVDDLVITDPETDESNYANDLLEQYSSFYELMMLSENDYRYAIARVVMKDGTIYAFDFNLSLIDCDSPNKLFQLAGPIFEAHGYSTSEIRELIELAPMEHLTFKNKKLHQFDDSLYDNIF